MSKLKLANFLVLILMLFVFLPLTTAQTQQSLGVFSEGDIIQLTQICANCTFVNITSVFKTQTYEVLLGSVAMQKQGTVYNYTFDNTNFTGKFIVQGVGDPDGNLNVWAYSVTLTPNGEEPTIAKAFFYMGLVALLVFFLCLIFWAHLQDQSHLARFWWFSFMWIPIWAILFVGWSMARDFLTSQGAITGIFWWAWLTIGIIYPFFILGLVLYTFYYIYQQKEVQRLITRGFSLEDAQGRVNGRGRGMNRW